MRVTIMYPPARAENRVRDIDRMEQRILVRPAETRDTESIAEIYGWYVSNGTATFETDAPDAMEMARRLSDVLSRNLPWLVAELEGRVVGNAYA